MIRRCCVMLVTGLLLSSVSGLEAAVCQDLLVDLGATISTNPVQVKLDWALRLSSTINTQVLYRRVQGAAVWGVTNVLATNTVTFTDSSVSDGVQYEYW